MQKRRKSIASILGLRLFCIKSMISTFPYSNSPEETLPGGEVGALEERVFQYTLHTTQGLDHVRAVVVQVPQFAVMTLMGPPEGILLQHLQDEARKSLEELGLGKFDQ